MKKKIILRGAVGVPIGITIGYLITIFTSLGWGNGYYFPCVPELILIMGNEINMVIVQMILCALLGIAFAASSVIWEMEYWSIAKQTVIYFFITSIVMMPTAWFLHWMEHTITGSLIYLGIFVMIFIFIWLTQYFTPLYNFIHDNQRTKVLISEPLQEHLILL